MAVGDRYAFSTYCIDSDQLAVNTFAFQVTAVTINQPDDLTVAGAIDGVYSSLLQSLISAQCTYLGSRTQFMAPGGARQSVWLSANRGVGTVTGDLLPRGVSLCVTIQTGGIGRSRRGRKYLPFQVEPNNQVDGSILPAWLTTVNTFAPALIAPISVGIAPTSCVVQLGVTNKSFDPIYLATAFRVNPVWATQRRRSGQGGPDQVPIELR